MPVEEIPVEEVSVPVEEPILEPEVTVEEKVDVQTNEINSLDEPDFDSDDEFGEAEFNVPPPIREKSVRELMEEVKDNPMVQEAIDLFGGKLTDVYENN